MISQLSAHASGSHLTKARANSGKFVNHGIKPSGQQQIQRWQCWCNPLIFTANLVLRRSTWAYFGL